MIGIPSLLSFELKEGTKPYHDRPFPVPSVLLMESDSLFCWISINILQQLNMNFVILMIEIDSYTQFEEPIHSL